MLLRLISILLSMSCSLLAQASCIGVGCTCTASASAVAFGSYNPGAASTSTGNVAVTCSALLVGLNVSYTIALDAGQHGSFTSSRNMISGSYLLAYSLSSSSSGSPVWGDGSSGTSTVSDSYLLNLLSVTLNYPVYGVIPFHQYVGPGSYTDTITVTVTY